MPAAFEFRDAETADHAAVFDLYETLFRHHVEQIWGWDAAWQIANFAEEWSCARTQVILVQGEMGSRSPSGGLPQSRGDHRGTQRETLGLGIKLCDPPRPLRLSGDSIAGYLQLKEEPDHRYILSLGILPEHQGQGIGRRIMTGLQEETARRGLPLRLSVFQTNPRALAFYESLGFQTTEATPQFHRLEWRESRSDS